MIMLAWKHAAVLERVCHIRKKIADQFEGHEALRQPGKCACKPCQTLMFALFGSWLGASRLSLWKGDLATGTGAPGWAAGPVADMIFRRKHLPGCLLLLAQGAAWLTGTGTVTD